MKRVLMRYKDNFIYGDMILLQTIYAISILFIQVVGNPTNKITEAIRLTRPKNIPATIVLSLAGAHIIKPFSITKTLAIQCIESTLIMSNSMIINDIYDVELDRINNNERPLIKGIIKKEDAIRFSILLSAITEVINVLYLPKNIRWIIHGALVYIHLYTPVLKKIPVIKNIACAILVAFSVVFSGLSSPERFFQSPNRWGLYIMTNAIFGGSWTNEILLDIRDVIGDKANGIQTLATLYGKETAWTIVNIILYINVWMNTTGLLYLGTPPFFYIGIMVPQFYMLNKVEKNKFSNTSIHTYLNYTTKTMFALLHRPERKMRQKRSYDLYIL